MSIKKGWLACLLFVVIQQNMVAQKRYKDEIFTTVDSALNIQYGQAINLKGNQENLLLDVIMPPAIDTEKKRPLLIFIHGGGFKNNSKTGGYSAMLCNGFGKRGYVTATIDYRLGVGKEGTNKDYYEAMYRAQQDGKAAIRFFRKNAALYGIDTNQIFITGSSAGSKTCLAIAYMNLADVPTEINTQKWGTLEGNSGNEGYSSKVNGVMNAWGAMPNLNWINKGDVPLFNVAGTEDKTVPYDSSYDYHGFKYGPYILFQRCLSLGIGTGWRPFYNTGHTLDNNKIKQDSCIQSMAAWLYTQIGAKSAKSQEGVFRWQEDIDRFDSLNKVEKYNSNAIMFLGSSYIRLWKNIRQDVGYNDIIHRGFGGCNLREVAFYVNKIVYPHQPKALFMYVGNDIVAGEKDKSPDQVLELFKYIVLQVRKKYPTIPITWLQISPSEKRWAAWDKITVANKLIEAYCQSQPNLFYIESANKFLGDDGKPMAKYYRDDKLHYNEEGYKVWGKNIANQVKEISNK
jgi:lysophospholipase L1-like esterase